MRRSPVPPARRSSCGLLDFLNVAANAQTVCPLLNISRICRYVHRMFTNVEEVGTQYLPHRRLRRREKRSADSETRKRVRIGTTVDEGVWCSVRRLVDLRGRGSGIAWLRSAALARTETFFPKQ